MKLINLSAVIFAILIFGCAEKKDNLNDSENLNDSSDETITDDDTVDVITDGPKPPDWGECTGGWEQKEQINEKTGRLEARWCEPPANWRPAAPPDWGDCPDGWEQKVDKDEDGNLLAKYCEPILPPEGTECEPGYFAMFGSTKCQRIGDPCPEGEFAEIPNDAGTEIVYVSEGESIQTAIDNAKDGAVIAIGKGTFDEFFTITDKNITLWGACVEETVLSPTTPAEDPMNDAVITINSSDSDKKTTVLNLTLTGGSRQGLRITENSVADILKTSITGVKRNGAFIDKNAISLFEAVLIKETGAETDGSRGRGIAISDNSETTLRKVVIENNRMVGILVATWDKTTHAKMDAEDIIIRNTMAQQSSPQNSGAGVSIEENSTVSFKRVLVEKSRSFGITAATFGSGALAELTLSEIIVRNTLPDESNNTAGGGILIQDDSVLNIKNGLVEKNRHSGITAITLSNSKQAEFSGDNLIIRNTVSRESDKTRGNGITLQNNIKTNLSGVLMKNNRFAGIIASTHIDGTKIEINGENINVTGTLPEESSGIGGSGIIIEDSVSAKLSNINIEKNQYLGIFAGSFEKETETVLEIENLAVKDTNSRYSDKLLGNGIHIQDAIAVIKKALIEKNHSAGIACTTAIEKRTVIDGEEIVVKDTLPQEKDKTFGRGLGIQGDFEVSLSKIVVDSNHELGIGVHGIFGERAFFKADNLIISNTQSQESDKWFGDGLAIQENVSAEITTALIDSNRNMGFYATSLNHKPKILLKDLAVRNTKVRECFELGIDCQWAPEAPFGHGIGIYWGTEATLSNVVIEGNQNGIQIRNSKVFAGEDCSLKSGNDKKETVCLHILNNETAINAFDLPEDYDINSAFAEGKTFYDKNKTDFSGDEQPIPEPADPMDAMGGN